VVSVPDTGIAKIVSIQSRPREPGTVLVAGQDEVGW